MCDHSVVMAAAVAAADGRARIAGLSVLLGNHSSPECDFR
eukprot:COSAG01_NODE_53173_length_341_cov_0.640496_1_plen_39_part_10